MDNFREWLSDNLRYIILIGGILILLLLIFFGIRTVSGVMKNGDDSEATTGSVSDTEGTETPIEPADPLEKNVYPEINTLIQSYYEALGKRDVDTLKTLVDNFDPSDEAKIKNAKYIEGYNNVEVYTKKGLTDDSYIVLAAFNYLCTGIDTPVPALSKLYVVRDDTGAYKISRDAETDTAIQNHVAEVLQDSDVQALISETEERYQQAQQDPALKDFLDNLGKEATPTPIATEPPAENDAAADQTMVTANTSVFVRSAPSGDSEVIGSLDEGEQLVKTGQDESGLWIQVDYNGQTAYVFHEYVY